MKDIIYDLTKLGFSQKEAGCYVAALQFGVASAQQIGEYAGINRATTYNVLSELANKGLITPFMEAKERKYRAEPPARILTLLHLQQKEIEQRRVMADELMLRLQVFHNLSASKPVIRYHESFAGLRSMQKEYETIGGDIIQIVGLDTLRRLHGREATNVKHVESLQAQDRKIRSILVTDDFIATAEYSNVDVVCVPGDFVDVQGEMTVCGERLVLFSYTSGLIAIEIHSKTIANTARAVLELAWQRAKEWERNAKK